MSSSGQMIRVPRLQQRMPPRDERFYSSQAMPAVDLYQKGDSFIVRVEIPGIKLDDISICAQDNLVTI
jgi:HSP20 family molecular chaperone IbpA